MTWSHPRGLDPLLATTRAYGEVEPDVTIEWEARSLKGFEEASIADLSADFDLIAIDHPFMGKAFEQKALKPLDSLFDAAWLDDLARASVGPSFESYRWQGALWAIPIDAAAQVAAYRPDLLKRAGQNAPRTWDEVLSLAGSFGESGQRVAVPANPTHAFLAWATICHAFSAPGARQNDLRPAWWTDAGVDLATGLRATEVLKALLECAHPMSWDADPIELFEHMSRFDGIAYTPVAFGYSNYARPSAGQQALHFTGVPSGGTQAEHTGGMLGGVGLALSHRCRAIEASAAARFMRYVAGGAIQSGLYADAGGQPAHRAAWISDHVNAVCPNFFAPTLGSLDVSFIRPRTAAYPAYQRDGGILLHQRLKERAEAGKIVAEMNALWVSMQP
jgi:multiple sugar transport system substrate-binding protein